MNARQQIDAMRRKQKLEQLRNGDEPQQQLAATIAAAEAAANEYHAQRQTMVDSGHYTAEGLQAALAPLAEKARQTLERVYQRTVTPRLDAASAALVKLPKVEPSPTDLSEGERSRLIAAWQALDGAERLRTLADIHTRPKLVAALVGEDRLVVGLDVTTRARLLKLSTPADPHANDRAKLQGTLDDAEAVRSHLQSISDALGGAS